MNIKPDADEIYFSQQPEERSLAQKLDEAFIVNHGQKQGDLAFWFIEPKDHARERFGFQKEVLVIYSGHRNTDARVMKIIEYLSQHKDHKDRFDKVLSILIHAGDRDKTVQLCKAESHRIIVPMHIEELKNPRRGSFFLRRKIAEAIGAIDLFGMSSPIKTDNYFFGRNELVQTLLSRATVKAENSGLFGLRKTGKTSVLYAIERRLANLPIKVEYIDSQGVYMSRWWTVLDELIRRLMPSERSRREAGDGSYNSPDATMRFVNDIKKFIEIARLERLVLMFDEIEWLTPSLTGAYGTHWDNDFVPFWQSIRAAHQETKGKLTFIVAGVNPAYLEKSHFEQIPNPIFQLAEPHFLEPLTVQSVREMVRSIGRYLGLRIDEDVYPFLRSTYGGHPYLIRIACSEAWRSVYADNLLKDSSLERLMPLKIADFRSQNERIKLRLAQPIQDILLSLVWWYPEEYDMLLKLANGDSETFSISISNNPAMGLRLTKYGIINPLAGEFLVKDLKEFLIDRGAEYKKMISPFTRGDIPMNILPELPDIEVLSQLFEKRTRIETRLRRVIVLYLGMKTSWDEGKIAELIIAGLKGRTDRQDPRALFLGRSPKDAINELYTTDLKTIIIQHWELFSMLFDNNKSRLEMNLDTLNIARRVDAHSKPITESEKADFDNSYAWLWARLAKVPD